jgi:desampylase
VDCLIPIRLLGQIERHVASATDREVCGLLFGTLDAIEGAEPTANVADRSEHSFEIDPAALFSALRRERGGGPRLIGHYHSHPNGSTEPSLRDLAAAEPGRLWLILGRGAPRLWWAEVGRFAPVRLIATD